jgi:hypothetical protein
MGFKNVYHYHGGIGEKGKDIVMWKADNTGERENYAVVAKVGKITAAVGTRKGSAGEVSDQIRQCFNHPFIDKTSGGPMSVHRVVVAASGHIGKDSIEAINGLIKEHSRYIKYYSGDEIKKLSERYLPRHALGLMDRGYSMLSNQVPELDLSVTKFASGLQFNFRPKAEGGPPPKLSFRVSFDSSKISKQLKQDINRFHKEGGILSIPDSSISDFKLPIPPETLGMLDQPVIKDLIFTQHVRPLGNFRLERVIDGKTVSLEGVELAVLQSGSTKAKIGTRDQDKNGFKIVLDINKNQSANFTFTLDIQGVNAVQAHRAAEFAVALTKPGTLRLVHTSTSIEFGAASGAVSRLNIQPSFVELLSL